jgi:Flp pilus assembly protein TadD
MRLLALLPLAAALTSLTACATDGAGTAANAPAAAAPAPTPAAPPPVVLSVRAQDDMGIKPVLRPDLAPAGGSDGAAFLAGRAAMDRGRSDTAYGYLSKAPGLMDDAELRGRAFSAALLSGDVPKAAALAPAEPGDDTELYRLGRLTQVVEAMASGRGKDAQGLLADDAVGYPYKAASALLAPWAAAMAGDTDAALVSPTLPGDRMVEIFGLLGHAIIAERLGRLDVAEADYTTLAGTRGAGSLFLLDYGAFLERRGRRAEAVAMYDRLLARTPGDMQALEARARAAGRKKAPPMLTFAQGAAYVLTGPSASALVDRRGQTAMAYLRLVLRLDPTRTDALLLVGDILQASSDDEGARAVYQRIPRGAPQYIPARTKLALSYQAAGDRDAAIRLAREMAKAFPADQDVQLALVNLLHANGQDAEAVSVLDALVAKGPTWRLLYTRATVLDAAGRWPEAERDLKDALALSPDEPVLLNILGYNWISRGEHLPEALAMVKRAAEANPRSGAVLDSLGWAYYRTGDFKMAVETLERAVLLEPGDPELNNHLGDAYWRVGRQDEARFQWRRVLTLEPDDTTRQDAEKKLKDGLDGAPPGAAAVTAANP